MFVKNTGDKIIGIGTKILMPDETIEITDTEAASPALKVFMQFGYLMETVKPAEEPVPEKKAEEEPKEEEPKEEKPAEEPAKQPVKKKKAADKAE